jgi:colanic acid/amylovoran biosynthesis protein
MQMENTLSKQVLIVNVHSIQNAGDAALLWLNMKQLEAAFPNPFFTVLVNYPHESYKEIFPNLKVIPSPFSLIGAGAKNSDWRKVTKLWIGFLITLIGMALPKRMLENFQSSWLKIALLYRSADMIVAVSGAQLVSFGRYSWPLIVSSVPIIFAHLFRKPLYVMPQSIGPFRWSWEKFIIRNIYSRARLVFLRDLVSMNLAREIGIPEKKVIFSSDPGFALPEDSSNKAVKIMANYGYRTDQHSVGLTVVSRISRIFDKDSFEKYYLTLAKTLTRFTQEFDTRIYIFDQVTGPTAEENDGNSAELFLKMVPKDQDRIIHVNQRLNPMELKACYRLMDVFIASRLHSGIFAMSCGVPTLYVGYNPKTRGVLEAIGLNQWLLDLNEINSDDFWSLLQDIWKNRRSVSEETKTAVIKCQKDFSRVSQWITEDYFNDK